MFVIQHKQLTAFKGAAFKKFENEMVRHIKSFFPSHFTMIGEDEVRATIEYGYQKAKEYGFSTQRNVCLYLNTMILLGSNFNIDPQYPWAKEILFGNEPEPEMRIDKLADKTLELVHSITGEQHIHLNRALLHLHHNGNDFFDAIMNKSHYGYWYYLEKLYPKKYEVIGAGNINAMVKMGKVKAFQYNFQTEPGMLLYVVLMFVLGSGFDRDPQYPWAERILADASVQEQEKLPLLFERVMEHLRSFINKVNL